MTVLTNKMYEIFDQEEFSFKKLKVNKTPEEIDTIKQEFKGVWQIWKTVQLNVAEQLPTGKFAKVHVESWTNGWNLRDHFWASYRLTSLADYNPCIGVMLDKKQLQVYLMFQHYKSEKRQGTVNEYNKLLVDISDWSSNLDIFKWYIWDKSEMEFVDHLSLEEYLSDSEKKKQFDQEAIKSSFLLGKFAFRDRDKVNNMEKFIIEGINALIPLYEKLS
ncbi:MAG: glucose-6-phosphate 1-dehydrogenase family protein [Lactobacillus johnsonii]|nr:glucose-6-phosphate 1-dehydrogenase family protein [Lactobacillus johnsonii]MDY5420214.1 glucose-6-phosphate 1-dehydrogenase family protein [Lactobacillus johnsonii]